MRIISGRGDEPCDAFAGENGCTQKQDHQGQGKPASGTNPGPCRDRCALMKNRHAPFLTHGDRTGFHRPALGVVVPPRGPCIGIAAPLTCVNQLPLGRSRIPSCEVGHGFAARDQRRAPRKKREGPTGANSQGVAGCGTRSRQVSRSRLVCSTPR